MKINNLCIVDTPYSLLVYLLYRNPECIEDTFFIFGENINKSIVNYFPHKTTISTQKVKYFGNIINGLYYRFQIIKKIPKFKNISIYAHDHLHFSSIVIGNNDYTLIEDSPYICTNYSRSKNYINNSKKQLTYYIFRFIYGKLYKKVFGNNRQCKALLLTQKDEAPYIKDKIQIIFSLKENWAKLKENQQRTILNIFSLTPEDIKILKSRPYILFTQPITDFKSIDLNKQGKIYKKVISKYPSNLILIKVHPRDEYDYESNFPNCAVFKKSIPSQLLDITGIKYKKAITLFSTAATSFNYPIEVDWYGTKIDENLLKDVGDIPAPQNNIK